MLRVTSPGFSGGSKYQISALVQWLVRAVEPQLAAEVDSATMQAARELVGRVGTDNQREIVELCCQLEGLQKAAASTSVLSERENAERTYTQVRASLQELFRTEQKFEQLF